jgi:hypothetical protein
MTHTATKILAAFGFAALVTTGAAMAGDKAGAHRSSDGSVQGSATMPSTASEASSPGTPGAPSKDKSEQAMATSDEPKEVEGRVERLERDDTIRLSGTESVGLAFQPLKLEPSTEVVRDGKKVSPDHIQEGDEVRASFSGSGDDVRLERIEILPSTTGSTATTPSRGTDDRASPSGTGESMSGSRDDELPRQPSSGEQR